jgi:hypothetical protein
VIACPDCGRATPGWDVDGRCLTQARRAAERWTEPALEPEPEGAPKAKPVRTRCRRDPVTGVCDLHGVLAVKNGRAPDGGQKWRCGRSR